MLLFGLFRRNRLLDHLARPRLDAESPTFDRGLCWYVIPIRHDVLSPSRPALWHLLKRYYHLNEILVHSFSGICAIDLNSSERGYRSPLALNAGFAHEARVLRPLTWMNSNLG